MLTLVVYHRVEMLKITDVSERPRLHFRHIDFEEGNRKFIRNGHNFYQFDAVLLGRRALRWSVGTICVLRLRSPGFPVSRLACL